MKKHIFGFFTLLFAFFWVVQTLAVASSVKSWLDEESLVHNGGLAYGVCFFIAGMTVPCLGVYSWYLIRRGWSWLLFTKAVRLVFAVAGVTAVVCTIWFMVFPGYMNPVGLLGLAVSMTTATWGIMLCNRVLALHLATEPQNH